MADKKYTDEQEQIARFAKAMGRRTAYSESYSFTTS